MAAEVKVPDEPTTLGKKLTKVTPIVGNPLLVANDGDVLVFVKAGAAESKVKVTVFSKVDGIGVVAREIAVKEGFFCIGRFEMSKYNNEENQIEVNVSVATELEIYFVKES